MPRRSAEMPYPFSGGSDVPTGIPNLPCPLGEELGKELARLSAADIEAAGDKPCDECAFVAGTVPNRCLVTVADALKCVMERSPFLCHKPCGGVCKGFVAVMRGVSDPQAPGEG